MTEQEIRAHLKGRLHAEYGSLHAAEAAMGVGRGTLSRVVTGKAKEVPGWLLEWAGIKRVVTYRHG